MTIRYCLTKFDNNKKYLFSTQKKIRFEKCLSSKTQKHKKKRKKKKKMSFVAPPPPALMIQPSGVGKTAFEWLTHKMLSGDWAGEIVPVRFLVSFQSTKIPSFT